MLDATAKYIYTVYKAKSVSAAAEELFISQPALSRAIKKAEDELGAKIFNRKTLPFSLTVEGKVYVEAIEKMLEIERETAEKMSDISHMRGGTLRIATSTHVSLYVIPKVLKVFQKKYPQVDTHIVLTSTSKLLEHLQDDTADLIFARSDKEQEGCVITELFREHLVVVMPRSMANDELMKYAVSYRELCDRSYCKELELCDMSLFRGLEFIYSSPNKNVQKKRRLSSGNSDMTPYITSSMDRQQLNYNLMRSGFGALLTTDANIVTMRPDAGCVYFVLSESAQTRKFSIIHPEKDDGSNYITEEFVKTAKEIFSCENPLEKLSDN
ncbi:MAG: LysR family transcriptional regulator [Oscillospiraceae bacterium]|nr:LysR family transcriptional regulator [Oscillospiraceae bacterium]